MYYHRTLLWFTKVSKHIAPFFPNFYKSLYYCIYLLTFFTVSVFSIKHKRYTDIRIVFIRTGVDVTSVKTINETDD